MDLLGKGVLAVPSENLRRFSSILKIDLVYENQDGQLTAFLTTPMTVP